MANGEAVFDTFSIGESLRKVFDEKQTKVLIEAITSSRSEAVSHAALEAKTVKIEANAEKHESKVLQAIVDSRKDTSHAIAAMEARFDAKFDVLRTEVTWVKWILGVLATGIFVPLLKGMFQ